MCLLSPRTKQVDQSGAGLWYLRSCPVNQGLYLAILEPHIGGNHFHHVVRAHSVPDTDAEEFAHIPYFILTTTSDVGTTILPTLQIRKMSHREGR